MNEVTSATANAIDDRPAVAIATDGALEVSVGAAAAAGRFAVSRLGDEDGAGEADVTAVDEVMATLLDDSIVAEAELDELDVATSAYEDALGADTEESVAGTVATRGTVDATSGRTIDGWTVCDGAAAGESSAAKLAKPTAGGSKRKAEYTCCKNAPPTMNKSDVPSLAS